MLLEYSKRFSTVEVDDTFYGIPPEPLVRLWRDSVPEGFSFALKAPQQVTHEQRFSGPGGLLKRFLGRVAILEGKLGPILFLAPIGFEPNEANRSALRMFIETLPSEFLWALELRQKGWFTEEVSDLCRKKNVAMVAGENRWISRSSMLSLLKKPTADFAYIRWGNRPGPSPSDERSEKNDCIPLNWGKTLEGLSSLVEAVYGYFNINALGNGLRRVDELQRAIGQQWMEAPVSEK